ncbi:MAG: DUF58 domain-containing protein [Candidatus Nanopelagicales bacterium]
MTVQPLTTFAGLRPTARAWLFLASGTVCVLVGFRRGWPPVAAVGTLLVLLPLLSLGALWLTRTRVEIQRTMDTNLMATGQEGAVTLELRVRSGHAPVLLSDHAPRELGGRHQVSVSPSGGAVLRAGYRVRAAARGRYRLGPITVSQADRLGLAEHQEVVPSLAEIIVTPQVSKLDSGLLGGLAETGRVGRGSLIGGQYDDVIPRGYRAGDELRRVNWRATARTGSLMVRTEEQPWHSGLLIVVDLSDRSHHGRPPASSADAALGMVASVGALALREGWELRIATFDNQVVYAGTDRRDLLTALADVPLNKVVWPERALTRFASGPVLLVLGEVSTEVAGVLSGMGQRGDPRMSVLVATGQWGTGQSVAAVRGPAELLVNAGWQVATLGRHDHPPEIWRSLGVRV